MDEMLSLWDFLGKPAGPELGKKVAEEAARLKVGFKTRNVSTPNYTGEIMLYPESFLKQYFKK